MTSHTHRPHPAVALPLSGVSRRHWCGVGEKGTRLVAGIPLLLGRRTAATLTPVCRFCSCAARYQDMTESARARYMQAAELLPQDGRALNQLGVCSTDLLEALFFYCSAYVVHRGSWVASAFFPSITHSRRVIPGHTTGGAQASRSPTLCPTSRACWTRPHASRLSHPSSWLWSALCALPWLPRGACTPAPPSPGCWG